MNSRDLQSTKHVIRVGLRHCGALYQRVWGPLPPLKTEVRGPSLICLAFVIAVACRRVLAFRIAEINFEYRTVMLTFYL